MEAKQLDPIKEHKKLEGSRSFKETYNLYDVPRQNEKFKLGMQWDSINSKNLKKNVYNFIGRIMAIKNASILANELGMIRTAPPEDDDNERVQSAVSSFNLADKRNWERLGMDAMNEQLVDDASMSGLGVSYWYWDDELIQGNTYKSIGDIAGELVDMTDLYVANPQQIDVQKQPWCKITRDMTVQEAKDYAKKKGVSDADIEMIKPDEEEIAYRGYAQERDNQNTDKEDQLTTLMINFEMRDGQVVKSECFKRVIVEEWKELDLTCYPIAIMPYKPRKNFIYGEAEATRYLENQVTANMQISMRHKHAALMAVPKVVYNKAVTKSFSNAIGSINGVNLPPGTTLDSVIKFVQPAAMTLDVDKSVEDAINRSMDLAGVNQNLQGAARPENAAALLTQIKQAAVPIEAYKRRLYHYIQDVSKIWLEFYTTKYNMTRALKDEEGEVIQFTGTEFADINMDTNTDVGPSTQWSEITSFQMMMDMWNAEIITDPKQVIERLPQNSLLMQNDLIDEVKTKELLSQIYALMVGPENAEQLMAMPPEEQMAMVQQMMQPQQPMV